MFLYSDIQDRQLLTSLTDTLRRRPSDAGLLVLFLLQSSLWRQQAALVVAAGRSKGVKVTRRDS